MYQFQICHFGIRLFWVDSNWEPSYRKSSLSSPHLPIHKAHASLRQVLLSQWRLPFSHQDESVHTELTKTLVFSDLLHRFLVTLTIFLDPRSLHSPSYISFLCLALRSLFSFVKMVCELPSWMASLGFHFFTVRLIYVKISIKVACSHLLLSFLFGSQALSTEAKSIAQNILSPTNSHSSAVSILVKIRTLCSTIPGVLENAVGITV